MSLLKTALLFTLNELITFVSKEHKAFYSRSSSIVFRIALSTLLGTHVCAQAHEANHMLAVYCIE